MLKVICPQVKTNSQVRIRDYTTPPSVTFELPPDSKRRSLRVNDLAKLVFEMPEYYGERMWVRITKLHHTKDPYYEGALDNQPFQLPIALGDRVVFSWRNVIAVQPSS